MPWRFIHSLKYIFRKTKIYKPSELLVEVKVGNIRYNVIRPKHVRIYLSILKKYQK